MSAETRAAKRAYWNSTPVWLACKALDLLIIWTGATLFAVLASLNNF